MSKVFDVISFGISDRGLVRKKNEDFWHSHSSHQFYVLADGMGGHRAGDVAAKEAVNNLISSIERIYQSHQKENIDIDHIATHLHYAIQDANCYVKQLASEKEELQGMGTTLSCVLVHKGTLIIGHIGDSRIYRYKNTLKQLTEDHTLRNHLLKKGKLTLENVERYPYKNRITRALGTHDMVVPDIDFIVLEPDDVFFLCSDGLTDHLKDEEISYILKNYSCIEKASKILVEAAKKKGGRDNITVVMIKILEKS